MENELLKLEDNYESKLKILETIVKYYEKNLSEIMYDEKYKMVALSDKNYLKNNKNKKGCLLGYIDNEGIKNYIFYYRDLKESDQK